MNHKDVFGRPGIISQETKLCFNALFQDNLGKPAPERYILNLNEARDDAVAVTLAGPYADYLHFTAFR